MYEPHHWNLISRSPASAACAFISLLLPCEPYVCFQHQSFCVIIAAKNLFGFVTTVSLLCKAVLFLSFPRQTPCSCLFQPHAVTVWYEGCKVITVSFSIQCAYVLSYWFFVFAFFFFTSLIVKYEKLLLHCDCCLLVHSLWGHFFPRKNYIHIMSNLASKSCDYALI